MRQLAFELAAPPAPALDNFVAGRNSELVAALGAIVKGSTSERFLYIWGTEGSGKSHLLAAAARALFEQGKPVVYAPDEAQLPSTAHGKALIVDDVHLLAPEGQRALFSLYNALRETEGTLVAGGNAPPAALALRADLLTRLGWGLVYQVHPLSDEHKAAALAEHARSRGLRLPAEVIGYLFNRHSRDLRHLVGLLDALDRYSLETKRPITVPLLRELLADGGEPG